MEEIIKESKYDIPEFSKSILNWCKKNKIEISRNKKDVIKFKEKYDLGRQYLFHISNDGEIAFNILQHSYSYYGKTTIWISEEEMQMVLKIMKRLKTWLASDCKND